MENFPKGIRYANLVKSNKIACPETKINTIHGTIYEIKHRIDKGKIKDIVRPEKGLCILRKYLKEKEYEMTEYEDFEQKIKSRKKIFINYLLIIW